MAFVAQKALIAVIALLGLASPNLATISDSSAEIIEDEIVLTGQLKRICGCESAGDPLAEPIQFLDNGIVLKGRINPKDIGSCQINLDWWGKEAERLGYNIFTREGNFKMAKWIYENHGSEPWSWSKNCWK